MKLGALDSCFVPEGHDAGDFLRQSVELAPLLERWGYCCHWLTEHHTRDATQSSPEVLLPLLAAGTRRIRVGTAGILLGYHSPYRVATAGRMLEALFPGRIDLGLARGKVPDFISRELTFEGSGEPDYSERIEKVLGFLDDKEQATVNPAVSSFPEVWILGSNTESMKLAARTGRAFCLALFIPNNSRDPRVILDEYRQTFQPSTSRTEPLCSVAIAGACAPSSMDAIRQVTERPQFARPTLVGDPDECREQVDEIRAELNPDELIFLELSSRWKDRRRSYQLLAEALGVAYDNKAEGELKLVDQAAI